MTHPNGTDVAETAAQAPQAAAPDQIDLTAPRPVDIDLTEAETIGRPNSGADDGGDVARKPDEIVAEIEATRAELADTIDAIASRLSPRKAASRAKAQVTGAVSAPAAPAASASSTPASDSSTPASTSVPAAPTTGPAAPRALFSDPKVLAVAGVVGAVIALLVFRRRR